LTLTFADAPQLQAAPLAATATQRLTAQIGLALFDDPTMDLTQIANLVTTARSDSQIALLPAPANETTEARDGRS